MAPNGDASGHVSGRTSVMSGGAGKLLPPVESPCHGIVAQILGAVPHSVFWKDCQGVYLGCNEEFARAAGLGSAAEIVGKTDFDLPWPRAEAEAYRADDRAVIESGRPRRNIVEPLQQADGRRLWVDTTKVPLRAEDGRVCGVVGFYEDVTQRQWAEAAIQLNESRLEALLHLNQMTDATLKDIAEFAMEEAVRLTRSRIGYIAFANEDESVLTMFAWSKDAMAACAVQDRPVEYLVAETGLWGEAVRQRRPVITNDYAAPNPWKKGTPAGHVTVHRHMNVPVFDGDRIVIVAGVGNKESDYDESDVRQLTLLMSGMWRIVQRKRAEEKLRESETKYRALFESAGDATFVLGVDNDRLHVVESNPRALEMFGATGEQIRELPVSHFWALEQADGSPSLEAGPARVREAMDAGMASFEWRHRRLDGTVFDTDVVLTRVPLGTGLALLAVVRDVTERKRTENELRESERKFRDLSQEFQSILGAIPGSLVLISPDMKIVWANEYTKNTSLGFESSDMLGQYCYRCRHDLSEPCEGCPVLRSFASGKPESGERDTPNGKIWELHAAPVFGDQGEVSGVIEIAFEVTEYRRAERELKDSESRLRGLFRAAPIGIIFVQDRTTVSVNEFLCDLLGYSQAELVGKSARHLYFTQEEFEEVGRELYEPSPAARHAHIESRLRRKDGAAVDVSLTSAPLRLDEPAAGFVVTVQDITERKRAEALARQRHDEFLAILNGIDEPVYVADPVTYEMVYVNRMLEESFGACAGRKCYEYLQRRNEPCPFCTNDRIFGEYAGRSYVWEFRNDVSRRAYKCIDKAIPWPDGRMLRLEVAVDITERKRAEERLRESEALLVRSQQIARLGSWELDVTSNRLTWSDEVYRIFGSQPNEFAATYEAFLDAVHPDDRAAVDDAYSGSLREGRDGYEIDHRVVRRDTGEVRYVHEQCIHERDAAGVIIRSVGMVQDITERKRAEEALRLSEATYRSIFNTVRDAIWVHDLETREFIDVNDSVMRLFGYSVEEVQALNVGDISSGVHPFTQETAGKLLDKAAAGEPQLAEWHCRHKDGHLFWSEVQLCRGTIAGRDCILAIERDITERKQAEAELLREKEFTEKLLESLPGIFFLYDSTCHLKRWNKAHETVMGFTADELRDWYIPDWHETPEEAAAGLAFVKSVLDTGVSGSFETTLVNKQGCFVPYLISITRLMTPDGPFMMGVGIDVTERKRAEEERDRLFNLSLDMLCIAGFDGRFKQLNPAWARALGWSVEELMGPPYLDLVHPDDVAATVAAGECLRQGQEVRSFENRYRCKDGTYRWLSWNSYPLLEQQRIFAVCRDVTERKAAEEERARLERQLRQSQKMEAVGQLAGGVAHDFNNILTAILGNVDLVQQTLAHKLPADEAPMVGLREVERGALRAADLTRQLLLFSRRGVAQPEPLHLNQTLDDAVKMLQRLLTENVRLDLRPAPDLLPVWADGGQMEQVIVNLVVNARDAMPDGGRIVIETSNEILDETYADAHADARPGPHVLLAVSDTGEGMTRATMERIFEPFFTTKPVGQGTGLGLATVYGIVTQAGGHIGVYSEVGRGSTFRVYLPALTTLVAETPGSALAAESPAGGGAETILVCEDDDAVRKLVAQILRREGYTVVTAADGEDALRRSVTYDGTIHLLITDVIMPDINGRRLTETLLEQRPDLRTLFISGYTADIIAHHGVLDDNVEFLAKPFSRRALLRRVREVLDGARPDPPRE